MPYTEEQRRALQYDALEKLVLVTPTKGDLNHAICELTALLMLKADGMGYTNVSYWIDAVGGAHDELRRRLLDPYEDVAKEKNGDVRSFVKLIRQIHPQYGGHRKDA